LLSRFSLRSYKDFARYLFYTATIEKFDEKAIEEKRYFIGESRKFKVYLFYQPDPE